MARRRNPRRRPAAPVPSEDITLVVCRGGDCGNKTKHPRTDHAAQLAQFRFDTHQSIVIASTCLDACEHSNVVVVLPGRDGRSQGAGPVWIGNVNDTDTTLEIIDWVNAGGPGPTAEPTLVQIHTFRPSRLSRHELEPYEARP